MEYNQIGITAFVENEKGIYDWLYEFRSNPQIWDDWTIEFAKVIPHLNRMDLEIKHKNNGVIALIFVNFVIHDRKKTILSNIIKNELEKIV